MHDVMTIYSESYQMLLSGPQVFQMLILTLIYKKHLLIGPNWAYQLVNVMVHKFTVKHVKVVHRSTRALALAVRLTKIITYKWLPRLNYFIRQCQHKGSVLFKTSKYSFRFYLQSNRANNLLWDIFGHSPMTPDRHGPKRQRG